MIKQAASYREDRERFGSNGAEMYLAPPDKMPGFSKVALGLSYLDAGAYELRTPPEAADILDALEEDCPEVARQALEDALQGNPRDVPERVVSEHEREAVAAALAKGMRLIVLDALKHLTDRKLLGEPSCGAP